MVRRLSGVSSVKKLLVAAAVAACAISTAAQASTIFAQDFSAGLTANEGVGGEFGVHNGTVGNAGWYSNNAYSYYDLSLDLTSVEDAFLAIDYDIELESFHDRFNVLASTGAFAPPAGLLTPISGMSYTTVNATAYTWLTGQTAISEDASGRAVFDLASFAGQTVNLRFQFQTDYSVTGRGVNLDNVLVTGERITSAVPEPATWAMMLVGFFGAGSALRRARRTGIAALA